MNSIHNNNNSKPKVISFFCGCGGSSLGYKMAGYDIILACDWEEKALNTYRYNFSDTPTLLEDIRNVNINTIQKYTNIEKYELDLLDGSPPCTPFSVAGKREKKWGQIYQSSADSKKQRSDDLFFEYIRLIDELRPKTFVAENVMGLIIGNARIKYFDIIIDKIKKLDEYNIEIYVLNANDYDVAQSRKRVIIIGSRKDLKINNNIKLRKKIPRPNFYNVTKDLIIPPEEIEFCSKRLINSTPIKSMLSYTKEYDSLGKIHPTGSWFNYKKPSMFRPIQTITTRLEIIHPLETRFLTPSELKRCSSIPDDFKFIGSMYDIIMRIGNCVPPNLIKYVAEYIKNKWLLLLI